MSVSVGGNYFKDSVINGKKRYIEGTTTKIEYKDVLLAFFLVQTVSDGSGSSVKYVFVFNTIEKFSNQDLGSSLENEQMEVWSIFKFFTAKLAWILQYIDWELL